MIAQTDIQVSVKNLVPHPTTKASTIIRARGNIYCYLFDNLFIVNAQ